MFIHQLILAIINSLFAFCHTAHILGNLIRLNCDQSASHIRHPDTKHRCGCCAYSHVTHMHTHFPHPPLVFPCRRSTFPHLHAHHIVSNASERRAAFTRCDSAHCSFSCTALHSHQFHAFHINELITSTHTHKFHYIFSSLDILFIRHSNEMHYQYERSVLCSMHIRYF